MKFSESLIILLLSGFALLIFSAEKAVRTEEGIKIRARGVCYLDKGITHDDASLISKYDAIGEMLETAGAYLQQNDSLIDWKIKKNDIMTYLSNSQKIFVFREGEESIDGYPAYISHIVVETSLKSINAILMRAKTDNPFRHRMMAEYKRINSLLEIIDRMKTSTKQMEEDSYINLINKLKATEWANKARTERSIGESLDFYLIALDIDKYYEAAYLGISEIMISSHDYSDLLSHINYILNIDKLNFPSLYSVRGKVYRLQGEYKAAEKELEKAIAIKPEYADSYCVLGNLYADQKDYETAVQQYNTAIKTDPYFFKPYYLRGLVYRKRGNYDEALDDFNKVISLNPMHSASYSNRGTIYYVLSDFERSTEEYSKAIYLDVLNPELYHNRAIAYKRSGNSDKAFEDYETYLMLTMKETDEVNYSEIVNSWLEKENHGLMLSD